MIGDGGYSPYHDVSDGTRCTCGHTLEDHWPSLAESKHREPCVIDDCPCERFEPDEDAA